VSAEIRDIRDGSEVPTGLSPETCEAERRHLLEATELLRQATEHGRVKALVWAWLGADEVDVHYRVSNLQSAGNTNLRGLAAGLADYVNRKCRGEV
jgi:hypothetical protein